MGDISFDTIPINLRVSGQFVEISNRFATQGLVGMPTKILLLGQKLASGTAVAGKAVRCLNTDHAAQLFGVGSLLHRMMTATRINNAWTEVWALGLGDDPAGVAAHGALTINAPATESGTLALYIDGTRVRIAAGAGVPTATLANNLAAVINANTALPITAAVDGDTPAQINLTCRWAGETGNAIDVRLGYYQDENLPLGFSATITPLAGGSGNPDASTALAPISHDWFTDTVLPWTDSVNVRALADEAARRFDGMSMMDMHVYSGARGTYAGLAALGAGLNSPHVSIIGANGAPDAPWTWAASLGAVCAYEATQDPARPMQQVELKGLLAPAPTFDLTERNLLLFDGISTWTVDAGDRVLLDNVITTYQTNGYGIEDTSYLEIERLKTLAFLRYSMRARIAQVYPRHKLAANGTKGKNVATPNDIRDELIALAGDWVAAGLVERIDQFKELLAVEQDVNDPDTANAIVPPNLVNQFRRFKGRIDFRV
ncbi:MAG: phage tail sheath subtilisin-like domain-containing protein [Rhodospirillaceae bacterium]|nr:phage tail sheath subtilisin-like domain-containing protein [Rhodospirillaceae bacterium]